MLTLLRVLTIAVGDVERGSRRGKEVLCSKAKEKESLRVESDPRRTKVTIMGKSKVIVIDVEQKGIGPIHVAPPNTLLTFTNKARIKGKVNMSLTSPLSMKLGLRSTTTCLSAQMVEMSKWTKVKTTFLKMTLIYMEACSNLQNIMPAKCDVHIC